MNQENKRKLSRIFLTLFCAIFIIHCNFSQDLDKSEIKDNTLEVEGEIEDVLNKGVWIIRYEGESKRNKVKRIRRVENGVRWEFSITNNNGHLLQRDINEHTKKNWKNEVEITIYPKYNTLQLSHNEYSFTPYMIIKANQKYIILQEIDIYNFDRITGQVLTKKNRRT